MSLDAIIISDYGVDTFSGISSMRLEIEGKIALIQVVRNYLENDGRIVLPIEGDGEKCWSSAIKLNGIYIFNYLTKHNFNVELIDSYFEEREKFSRLLQQSPHAVIISTTFIHSKQDLRKLVDDIRSLAPDIIIIVGGTFIYMSYLLLQKSRDRHYDTWSAKDDYLFLDINDEPSVDLYIVSLRGEQILCESLNRINQNLSIKDLPLSARLQGENYVFTNLTEVISNNKKIKFDWKSIPDYIFKSGVISMQASNGCPYKCAFCNFTKNPDVMLIKSVDDIIAELKAVSECGIQYVRFVDDNFRLGRQDLNTVCQKIVDENLPIQWMSFMRASTLKKVDMGLLRKSGCIEVQIGLESAAQIVLKHMNKETSPALYAEIVEKLLAAGINCSCCFIFGFPGETEETASITREFMKGLEHLDCEGIFTWSIFPFVLVPLSPIYEEKNKRKFGLTGYMQNWKHKTMDSFQARQEVIKTFFELDYSGPIYRGDNLNMLYELAPNQRKKFGTVRHRLAKLASKRPVKKHEIINVFSEVFYPRGNTTQNDRSE